MAFIFVSHCKELVKTKLKKKISIKIKNNTVFSSKTELN